MRELAPFVGNHLVVFLPSDDMLMMMRKTPKTTTTAAAAVAAEKGGRAAAVGAAAAGEALLWETLQAVAMSFAASDRVVFAWTVRE